MYKTPHCNKSVAAFTLCIKNVRSFKRGSLRCQESELGKKVPSANKKPKATDELRFPFKKFSLESPKLDWVYLCDPQNISELTQRKGVDIASVTSIVDKLNGARRSGDASGAEEHFRQLSKEAVKLPNRTHPDVKRLTSPRLVCERGEKPKFDHVPRDMETLSQHQRLLRYKYVGRICHPRAYYLQGDLALLEQALINYTLDRLQTHGYKLVGVPDLVHPDVVEACGVPVTGEDANMVMRLDYDDNGPVVLSGTSEMALAGMFAHQSLNVRTLPQRYVAVSRCYRAETARGAKESGLYRVYEFNKVEMFALVRPSVVESEAMLQEIVSLQQMLFDELELHYRVLEMSPSDLAASAYHKYDIEAWMPGRDRYGEISSASNCTNYQSYRLNIAVRFLKEANGREFVHTVNGTACALPRMLIAIFEQNQEVDSTIRIPEVLWPYMHGLKRIDEKKWVKVERIAPPVLPRERTTNQKNDAEAQP